MMMVALIRKDLRVFLVPTIGGIVLICCAYLIALAMFMSESGSRGPRLEDAFAPAATMGMVIIVLLASAYGGTSFAAERRERSAEWLNMLPVSRVQIIISKIVAAFASLTALWIFDAFPMIALSMLGRLPEFDDLLGLFGFLAVVLSSCWVMFALAWVLSTFLESAAIASSGAILFVLMVILTAQGMRSVINVRQDVLIEVQIALFAATSIIGFFLGTRYYLDRVEP